MSDGLSVDTRAGDIGQRCGDDQVDVARLQVPPELAELCGGDEVGAAVDHRVGVDPGHAAEDVIERTHQRNTGHQHAARLLGDRTSDDDSRRRVALQLLSHVQSLGVLADQHGASQATPLRSLPVEPVPPTPAARDQQPQPERHRQQQVTARDFHTQQERDDRHRAEDAQAGIQNAPVLFPAAADALLVPRAVQAQRRQPADRDESRDDGVRKVETGAGDAGDVQIGAGLTEPQQLGAEDGRDHDDRVGHGESLCVPLLPAAGARRRSNSRCSGSPNRPAPHPMQDKVPRNSHIPSPEDEQ